MGNSNAYCTYHQRRGYTTNSCKALEVYILDLIDQGKYEIQENASNLDHAMNTISLDDNLCVTLRREHPRSNPNLVTNKQVSLPPNPKSYSMIEQLKNTLAKIILYDLINTFKKHREVLYDLFKKEIVPINIYTTLFF